MNFRDFEKNQIEIQLLNFDYHNDGEIERIRQKNMDKSLQQKKDC